jgi:hypothetical protein
MKQRHLIAGLSLIAFRVRFLSLCFQEKEKERSKEENGCGERKGLAK